MPTVDPRRMRAYPCPTCWESGGTLASLHAERNKSWFDCRCPAGHIWQVVVMPLAS